MTTLSTHPGAPDPRHLNGHKASYINLSITGDCESSGAMVKKPSLGTQGSHFDDERFALNGSFERNAALIDLSGIYQQPAPRLRRTLINLIEPAQGRRNGSQCTDTPGAIDSGSRPALLFTLYFCLWTADRLSKEIHVVSLPSNQVKAPEKSLTPAGSRVFSMKIGM